ncbi:MAG: dihydroorotate dehydrogenase electron transfer subunit [Candidatus Schekmanbacteria bacterium]|nr:dihydroorotate dehydrogenase electron transfer subunit [Candidatus Schekmanbacteria bacterium]
MKCRVITNKQLNPRYYKLTVLAKEIADQAQPGQFVMLQVNSGFDPLLRRPFAIHRWWDGGEIEILYQIAGKGTRLLSQLCAGAVVDILGPLGKGFSLPLTGVRPFLLVAGSIGVAPLLPLAQDLISKQVLTPNQITLLAGGKSQADILAVQEFGDLGVRVKICTEDGSFGQKGLVTDLLAPLLQTAPSPVFACGPTGMLKAVAELCRQYQTPCQVSLEAAMACGVGACQGCVVKTQAEHADFKFQRVCCEGPVFEAEKVIW